MTKKTRTLAGGEARTGERRRLHQLTPDPKPQAWHDDFERAFEQPEDLARHGPEHTDRLWCAAGALATAENAEGPCRCDGPCDVHRRDLLELLLRSPCDPDRLRKAAVRAGWEVPRTLAAVAMYRAPRPVPARRFLPPNVLTGLHQGLPCLIFPDPDGPGRRAVLRALLSEDPGVVGPTVETCRAGSSWRLARRGLELLPADLPARHTAVHVLDHVRDLLLLQDRGLSRELAARKLAPLQRLRPARRACLAETLLAYLECGRSAVAIAERLHVHPQTVRHRMRQITHLFGPDIDDPSQALDYLIALHTWRLLPDDHSSPHGGHRLDDAAPRQGPHGGPPRRQGGATGGSHRRSPRKNQRKAAPHES
ncbi:PucR C-terminal helix-turn-helix domain-containing protein [Thermomonospora echinospora]|uniref:PucR C-terminal helix-turn-helix domain-containing protein n=1 Tax=Thermomonospora echinospora TaxID=1992 RepID=A0A1H5X9T9_9ACTN|nr:PucR family transcriptional regulator [Thermomonospora echinospora]SEG08534.1 PucR C-terminal helix-turn-helix domain-containing protein [Thermomonospora echinospora]